MFFPYIHLSITALCHLPSVNANPKNMDFNDILIVWYKQPKGMLEFSERWCNAWQRMSWIFAI